MMSDERLARQSNAQFSQMKKKDPVSKNQGYQRMVEKIGKRITSVAKVDVPGTEWEFVVFDKSEPNAFAMPGGKVGVNVGLIELANGDEDEDEVAAVIGHEVAHVARRHSNKRMIRVGLLWEEYIRHRYAKQKLGRSGFGKGGLWSGCHRWSSSSL